MILQEHLWISFKIFDSVEITFLKLFVACQYLWETTLGTSYGFIQFIRHSVERLVYFTVFTTIALFSKENIDLTALDYVSIIYYTSAFVVRRLGPSQLISSAFSLS